jgi:DNA-binding response OmpR family regulator
VRGRCYAAHGEEGAGPAGEGGGSRKPEVFDDGVVYVNFASHEVRVTGAPVALTPTEYRLLAALVRHRGQVLSPEKLLELAWSDPLGIGPERVKYSVLRLRRKLGSSAGADSRIEAVRGFGYRYRAAERRHPAGTSLGGTHHPPRPPN